MRVGRDVLLQMLQILFKNFTSFVIPNFSKNNLQSEYPDVDSFQF